MNKVWSVDHMMREVVLGVFARIAVTDDAHERDLLADRLLFIASEADSDIDEAVDDAADILCLPVADVVSLGIHDKVNKLQRSEELMEMVKADRERRMDKEDAE